MFCGLPPVNPSGVSSWNFYSIPSWISFGVSSKNARVFSGISLRALSGVTAVIPPEVESELLEELLKE